MQSFATAVSGLLVANVLFFVATYFVPNREEAMVSQYALYFPANPDFRYWQLVTYMFMHGGATHILFNMIGLASFGPLLERMWGARRFLVFYFLCGVGAAAIYIGVNYMKYRTAYGHLAGVGMSASDIQSFLETGRDRAALDSAEVRKWLGVLGGVYSGPMLGASGALYGILVAFGLTYPNAKLALMFVPVPVAAKFVIPALLTLDLLSGVTGVSLFGGGIAHFAHIGGAIIGFVLMQVWKRSSVPSWDR